MRWFRDLMSIDEAKFSINVLCLVATLGFGLWMYYLRGDIEDSLLSIIQTLIYVVGGINTANILVSVSEMLKAKNNKKSTNDETK